MDRPAHDRRAAGLIILTWLLLLTIMSALWGAPVVTGALPDDDDYLRMVRVFDLLDGTAAGAHHQPRLGPESEGARVPWSRLIDAPLVLMQGGFELFMDRIPAAFLTATIMPALVLLALLGALCWLARPFMSRPEQALYALLAVFFLWAALRQLMPGRVDHHMWQMLLVALSYGALARMVLDPARRRWPLLAGLFFATGLAIGVDIVPWLALGAVLGGLCWLARGAVYEQPGLLLGASCLGAAFCFHLALSPAPLWGISCDALSPFWLALAAIIAGFWALVRALPAKCKQQWWQRALCGAAIALPLCAVVYLLFPGCFHDPYGIENETVRAIWLDQVIEAQPIHQYLARHPAGGLFFALPLVAGLVISCMAALRCQVPDRRLLWQVFSAVMLGGFLLAFYQIRTMDFSLVLAVVPLAALLVVAKTGLERLTARRRLLLAGGCFTLGLLLMAAAIMHQQRPPAADKIEAALPCDLRAAASLLSGFTEPLLIAAPVDGGAALLFRTHHRILSAPYHGNEAGIYLAHRILHAPDQAQARQFMRESGAQVILFCPGETAPFAAQLARGAVPDWLQPLSQERIFIFRAAD